MLIRHANGRQVDYGIFEIDPASWNDLKAVKSSVSVTDISGNFPAIMTITMGSGETLNVRRFIAGIWGSESFQIIDREMYSLLEKKLDEEGYCGDITDVILFHNDDGYGWSISVFFNDFYDLSDGLHVFDVKSVSWTINKTVGTTPPQH